MKTLELMQVIFKKIILTITLSLISVIVFSQAISPTNMNILYRFVDNPIKIAVPEISNKDLIVETSNGQIKKVNYEKGEYIVNPSERAMEAVITIYTKDKGEKIKVGEQRFRVYSVPAPEAFVEGTDDNFIKTITKQNLLKSGGILARLPDFPFKGIRFVVTSFRVDFLQRGSISNLRIEGNKWDMDFKGLIASSEPGNLVDFYDIKVTRTDIEEGREMTIPHLSLEIK